MRKLAVVLAFVFPVTGFSIVADAATAKRKCQRGTKLVGKKCKRVKPVKKRSSKSKRANGVAGSVGASTFSIAPSADGKSATFTVTINCTSADGASITLSNGAGGKRMPFTAVVGAQTGAEVQYGDSSGNSLVAQIRGVYKTASRFDGEVEGIVTTPAGTCWLPETKVVLTG